MYKSLQACLLCIALTTGCNQDKKLQSTDASTSNKDQSVSVKYFHNGDLYIVESYSAGKLNGPVVGFFENRRVNLSGYYKAGKKDGTWLFPSQEGKLKRRVVFERDKVITIWRDSTLLIE